MSHWVNRLTLNQPQSTESLLERISLSNFETHRYVGFVLVRDGRVRSGKWVGVCAVADTTVNENGLGLVRWFTENWSCTVLK